jgi:parvulin-like peptidyl-prolyl isomerase
MDKELVTSTQGAFITIKKVIEDLRRYPPYKQPKLDSEKMVRDWLDRMVPYEMLISEGYKAKLHTRPEVRQKVTSQLESLMVARIGSREITEKVSPTEEDYKEYYEANKTKYKNPETVKVQEIYVNSNSLGTEIATRAKRGEDFNSLADEFNTRSTTKNNHGMLGYIRKDQYGNVGRTAFDMSVGEVAGPIKMGKNYSVIQVLDRKPEGQKDYDQAKSRVRSDVRKQMLTQREKEWIAELHSRSNVQVYEGILKKAFPSEDI